MIENHDRKFKIGMYSYILHLLGFGESRRFQGYGGHHASEQVATFKDLMDIAIEIELSVLHIALVDIQNDISDAHLAGCREITGKAGVELELNISFNAPSDPRVNYNVEDSLHTARKLGCDLVKYSTDVGHPEKSFHSCLTPSVMEQLAEIYGQFEKNFPPIEKYGTKITTENHCDLLADEVIRLVKQLNHPLVGACCGTINSLMVVEGIAECVRKMTPHRYCVHFCGNRVFADPDGVYSLGIAIGAGSVDCRAVMDILGEEIPDGLDTTDLEIELPLSDYSIEEGREMELKGLCESVGYMYKELGIGRNPAKIYGSSNYFLNK